MPPSFNTIGILGYSTHPRVIETLHILIQYLYTLKQVILIEAKMGSQLSNQNIQLRSRHELSQCCDLFIVVGGDGSLLEAAQTALQNDTPLLGINRGRLGFLTDIRPTEFDKIKTILSGNYIEEKRFLLTAIIEYANNPIGQGDALNEITLTPDVIPHMHEFEIHIDNQFVCSQHADGMIIATPTGSTAYALSGGGPILHPSLDAVVIVPMFPHMLSIRPIVLKGTQKITILITDTNTATPRLSCDSQYYLDTPPGSRITIQKKSQHLRLIHPTDYNYYETLRSKLHWGINRNLLNNESIK